MGCISSKHARSKTKSPPVEVFSSKHARSKTKSPPVKEFSSKHARSKTKSPPVEEFSSKHARSKTKSPPVEESAVNFRQHNRPVNVIESSQSQLQNVHIRPLEKIKEEPDKKEDNNSDGHSGNSKNLKKQASVKKAAAPISFRFGRIPEEVEHVAAGWPDWLSSAAYEAVQGWLPLSSDSFERLDKIGQGTYSSVYRARELNTGKMVALKKVKFDSFQTESIKFMAREIMILRKLDHPNVMKLKGIITSRLSCTVYFVFEYMEHDLSGLLSCPDIKFTESQIKCYMRQLLCGLEHCHSRGVFHRDIKSSNVLVNNEGILKIADFGLGNFLTARNNQALTSRVVTLWYRPPELLLGSTNYDLSVDLWSVGCVFAELFIGRPLLKGRTEVEQLHKIFKLCGTPPEEYWSQSKLPLATMFKPRHPYESLLRERCKEFPKTAVSLIETLLSIEPYKRGTASAALESEYFTEKPYACEPSSLPKYPPNKEIDAKLREEARRRKTGATMRASGATRRVRKGLQEPSNLTKVIPSEEGEANARGVWMNNYGGRSHVLKGKGATIARTSLKPSDTVSDAASQLTEESLGDRDSIRSLPINIVATSTNFGLAKRRKHGAMTRVHQHTTFRSQTLAAFDPSSLPPKEENLDSYGQEENDFSGKVGRAMQKEHIHPRRLESFDSFDRREYVELPTAYQSQSNRIDSRQESQIHQAARKSRFARDMHQQA